MSYFGIICIIVIFIHKVFNITIKDILNNMKKENDGSLSDTDIYSYLTTKPVIDPGNLSNIPQYIIYINNGYECNTNFSFTGI